MILTYPILLQIELFVACLLALACWLDWTAYSRTLTAIPTRQRLRDIPAIRIYFLLLVGLTLLHALSVALHWTGFWFGHPPHGAELSTTPVFPYWHYCDLYCYEIRAMYLHSDAFWFPHLPSAPNTVVPAEAWVYPPAAVIFYAAIIYGGMVTERYLAICAVLLIVPMLAFARWFLARGIRPLEAYGFVAISFLLSYPFWVELPTGNVEIFAFALIAAGILYYLRGRLTLAAILLGSAVAFKIFPFVFFCLFLARRQYRQIVYGAITIVVTNLFGLWLMAPGMMRSLRFIKYGLHVNREWLMLTRQRTTGIDHSLFGVVKQAHFVLSRGRISYTSGHVLNIYMAVVAVFGIVLYFAVIRKKPLLNQILALTVVSILLPPTSHDYTLMHLYTPWALLTVLAVQANRYGRRIAGLVPCMACFGILLSTQMEFILRGDSFGGQLKCAVLCVLLFFSLRYNWQTADLEPPVLEPPVLAEPVVFTAGEPQAVPA